MLYILFAPNLVTVWLTIGPVGPPFVRLGEPSHQRYRILGPCCCWWAAPLLFFNIIIIYPKKSGFFFYSTGNWHKWNAFNKRRISLCLLSLPIIPCLWIHDICRKKSIMHRITGLPPHMRMVDTCIWGLDLTIYNIMFLYVYLYKNIFVSG